MREESGLSANHVFTGISIDEFFMQSLGVSISTLVMDGQIHRFSTTGRRRDLDGWYVYYANPDGDVCITSSWKISEKYIWCSRNGLATEERKEYIRKAKEKAEEQRRAEEEKAAEEAASIIKGLTLATDDNPYLKRKGVHAYGVYSDSDTLYIPMLNADGEIVSYQTITEDGTKRFKKGGRMKGSFFVIGSPERGDKVYLAEGYATGASIHEATGRACIVAFNAHNLISVAEELKHKYRLTVIADNDSLKDSTGEKAAKATGLPYILIPDAGKDANDFAQDHGLSALRNLLLPSSWFMQGDALIKEPMPQKWLIKKWIPEEALTMVYGASNVGKSFVVLDQCLTLSTGLGEWFGYRAKRATCLYLCGEGQAGIRARIALWVQEHGTDGTGSFYVSAGPKYLNDATDLAFVEEQIDALGVKVDLVVIDTLSRHFSGKENDAQEMGWFINGISKIKERYHAAVFLIHHTGISKDAEDRARGSSSLNAAVDTGILISGDDGYLSLTQMKQRDVEKEPVLSLKLRGAVLSGWTDEDGEDVRSAVVVRADEAEEESEKEVLEEEVILECVWLGGEGVFEFGYPSVTEQEIKTYLRNKLGYNRDKANHFFRTDRDSRPIQKLLTAGKIQRLEDRILLVDPVAVSCLKLANRVECAHCAQGVPKVPGHN